MNGGQSWQEVRFQTEIITVLSQCWLAGITQTFDTEILQMRAVGSMPGLPTAPLIRESPTRRSLGMTSIAGTSATGGSFMVSSFFDVFTEISLDSGQTWSPVAEPTHLELQNNGVVLTP